MSQLALAAYQALHLIVATADEGTPIGLDEDVWRVWSPAILAHFGFGDTEGADIHHRLVTLAYRNAPNEVLKSLTRLIDRENNRDGWLGVLDTVEPIWDEQLAKVLLAKAQEPNMRPKFLCRLLSELLDHDVSLARDFAVSLIPSPPPAWRDPQARGRAVVAACALMNHARDAGWETIWAAIERDRAFGRRLIAADVHQSFSHGANVLGRLADDDLARLYRWLVAEYPPARDPDYDMQHSIGMREGIAEWRDGALAHLQQRGTTSACRALEELVRDLPELPKLKWILQQARELTARRLWQAPQPTTILELVANKQQRLVQDGGQLLDVLVESLERLQAKLQGETPAAAFLWNEWPQDGATKYRPVNEVRLSDFVKLHFDDDIKSRGVIANREVEFRPASGQQQGERTDIHVDAVIPGHAPDAYDTITAIVEVKGSWHRDVNEAMQTQLHDRYLRNNQSPYGLYLVGWFNCEQWDDTHYQKRASLRNLPDLGEARRKLEAQAAQLSRQGTIIRAVVLVLQL